MTVTAMSEEVYRTLQTHGQVCLLEEVMALCPHLTWNQVFLAVDHLSRMGRIQLKIDRTRSYTVKVLSHTRFRQAPARIIT